ncbi:Putative niacin/nicotinamide transporter NaiP [Paraburkholderia nemoris]|uniref:MFS transporter n=1 Tax=Paraburkholderia nemoris TaxID=2793076 RepID=UPI001914D449|nr:MFS transporter [Paraburkholderia nemoris]MBK5148538.1 MFS transporter [Burkholderia sp. R-69608]CAE6906003.1 Putative niacin/nicotinamide transporter NaiP [Paraburkholderia nemoris]
MFSWFRKVSQREQRTFWACFAGWALDAMDAQFYAVAIPALIGVWGLSKGQAGILSTVALLSSACGGWFAGVLSDRYGRVRVLQGTILWFSAFTLISGLTTSYSQLLVVRTLQGFGFGGEWAAGAVLIGEVIQAKYRGKAVGLVQGGWSVGYGAAVILYSIVFSIFPPSIGWRVLFFIGVLPALLVFVVRRYVEEPEIYLATRQAIAAGAPVARARELFSKEYIRTTFLASLLATGVLGGNYTILTWLPTYLKLTRGLSVSNTGMYLIVNICGSFLGYLASSHMSDRLGRRPTFILFAVVSAASVIGYMYAPVDGVGLMFFGAILGFCQSGCLGGMGAFFTELSPSRIRGTAQGFKYNVGRGIGGLCPAAVGLVSVHSSLGGAIAAFAVGSYLIVILATACLPETRGKVLEVYS